MTDLELDLVHTFEDTITISKLRSLCSANESLYNVQDMEKVIEIGSFCSKVWGKQLIKGSGIKFLYCLAQYFTPVRLFTSMDGFIGIIETELNLPMEKKVNHEFTSSRFLIGEMFKKSKQQNRLYLVTAGSSSLTQSPVYLNSDYNLSNEIDSESMVKYIEDCIDNKKQSIILGDNKLIAYDPMNNNLLIDPYECANSDFTKTGTKILLSLILKKQFNQTKEQIKDFFTKDLPQTDNFKSLLKDEPKEEIDKILDYATTWLPDYINSIPDEAVTVSLQQTITHSRDELDRLYQLYQEQLNIIDTLNYKLINYKNHLISDNFTKTIKDLTNKGYLYTWRYKYIDHDNIIVINLWYKHLPILYIDTGVLESCFKNEAYNFKEKGADIYIDKIVSGECNLMVAPQRVTIKIDINDSSFDIRTQAYNNKKQQDGYFINAHAAYNEGHGCLGNFKIPISQAIRNMDYTKIIYLVTQFLMTIAPADAAGKRTIENTIVTDSDFTKILYDARNRYNNTNLSDFVYTTFDYYIMKEGEYNA